MHVCICMSCGDARVGAQVAVIIAAAVVAQRQAEQDLDETDMSLAYSGGSGRVSHLCTCINNATMTHVPKGWIIRWLELQHDVPTLAEWAAVLV